jgi:hypothetical protein
MDNPVNNNPPGLLLTFFRWFCRPEFREDIEGDLLERFHDRTIKSGTRKARWLFIIDVLLLFRPGIIRNINSKTLHKFLNMKRINWIKLTIINLLLVLLIISPFLPGPPNKLVIGLSVFGQSAGFFGLLLVPVGLIWAIIEIRKPGKIYNESQDWKLTWIMSIIAIVIITAIYFLLLTLVFVTSGLLTGFLVMIAGIFGFIRAIRSIKKLRNNPGRKLNPVPFYLFTIPLVALVANNFLVGPASDYSRNYAIKKCGALIESIEEYKNKEGQYPEFIQDLEARYIKKIPSPSIMGILNFRYNKINDQYSISFSQWLDFGSLEEIVLYDKSDLKNNLKGVFAKYDYGLDLCRVKGAFAIHNTMYENWQYYLCD